MARVREFWQAQGVEGGPADGYDCTHQHPNRDAAVECAHRKEMVTGVQMSWKVVKVRQSTFR